MKTYLIDSETGYREAVAAIHCILNSPAVGILPAEAEKLAAMVVAVERFEDARVAATMG